jgi:hypothetical protein
LLLLLSDQMDGVVKSLDLGTDKMAEHERRLQGIEVVLPTLVSKSECAISHKALTSGYVKLLMALLVVSLSAITGLVLALLKAKI